MNKTKRKQRLKNISWIKNGNICKQSWNGQYKYVMVTRPLLHKHSVHSITFCGRFF